MVLSMDKVFAIVLLIYYGWSFYVSVKVIRGPLSFISSVFAVLILLIPLVGVIMYMFAYEQPPTNKYKFRYYNRSRSIGSYDNTFDIDAEYTKKKIDILKARNNKVANNTKEP